MQTKDIEAKIDAFIEANTPQLVEDLAALIAVKSLEGQPVPGAPFGPGPRAALDAALSIAGRLGLATNDGDGYVGWAELPGEREEYIATVTHLDVVPEGEGWDADPYTLVDRDGWLIGRGVEDDKGPSILCLYAAKFLQGNYERLPYTLRVLLGCNEESGMADIPYYLAHNKAPLFAFSPDTDFPVCNGEKGHFGAELVSPSLVGNLVDIKGGYAPNVIPDRASAVLQGDAEGLQSTKFVTVTGQDGRIYLAATGIGGHAAHPEGTVNAIGQLVEYILDNNLATEEENRFLLLLQKLHSDAYGKNLGVDATDAVFDPLTIIGGIISMEEGVIRQNMDSRFTPSTSVERMQATLEALAAQHGASLAMGRCAQPMYVPADSAPIRALMDTYNEVTGQKAEAYTMGGGTYARQFPQAVSFGPHDPADTPPDFVGPIHGANEGMSLASMQRALKIYILSLLRLQQIEY